MKRTVATVILLGSLGGICSAQLALNLDAPQDDLRARVAIRGRPELSGLQAAYWELIQTRLFPLRQADAEKFFGPKIATATNWWGPGLDERRRASGPIIARRPADLVLPMFVPETEWVSGLHSPDPARNLNHTDLHAIGDAGYAEFYYANDGVGLETALIYFRADENFVPLTTTNDFAKRLEWEKGKFASVKKWIEENMPKLTDLGDVEVLASGPNRVDLGGGTICVVQLEGLHGKTAVYPYQVYIGKEITDPRKSQIFTEIKTIDHAGQSVGFIIDGKFYRMITKVVEKIHAANK